jgi:DnaJ-class molecular chaperone
VRLRPGTQSEAALRLRGKGLPRFREHRRGDLFVRVRVRVPETLGREERELYERLRSLGTEPAKPKVNSAKEAVGQR